jgi:hypothetical protein
MKKLCLIPLLVATGALAAPPGPGVLLENPRTRDEPVAPVSTPARPDTPASREDKTMQLPPVMVIGSSRYANRIVEPVRVKDAPFTLVDGGYYWKGSGHRVVAELKLQYHPGLQGFDLASLGW